MNRDLLVRLFRAIDGDRNDDIVKIAYKIIGNEKEKGHATLATQLEGILDQNLHASTGLKKELKTIFPQNIPTSTRLNVPLATPVDRSLLRHHTILPIEIEEKIKRIEKEYVSRERLAHFGLKPRKKILFYGAPGCGKSMSAERIAWNVGLPFLKVRFEAIVSSYLGESASNLQKMFESIQAYPCVLLLDEFDFIAKSRSLGQDVGEMHRVVNILLHLLEEYNAPGLLIATTNLEGALDKALFRRFDDIIEIPRPGKNEIKQLLLNALSAIELSKKIAWNKLIDQMEGLSAALIVKTAEDAAKLSVINNEIPITQSHLTKALEENMRFN
jgi:SpoVK/Ycf46/Vps4 family AAA+-type ATPase